MGPVEHVKLKVTAKKAFGEIWRTFHQDSQILYKHNVAQALDAVRQLVGEGGSSHTLVTGIQHLVGGALFSLETPLKRRGVTCDKLELADKPEGHGIRNAHVTERDGAKVY